MKAYWKIEGDLLKLALEATATGWVAFGLGETTGMKGADIVYYEHAEKRVTDAHVLADDAKPISDKCQDWTLVAAEQNGNKLVVEVSRKLASSDPQDRDITRDDAPPLLPTPVIAAWGSGKMAYHGQNRVGGRVRFFGNAAAGNDFAKLNATGDVKTFDFKVSNFAIPADDTRYQEFCFDLQTLLNVDNATAQHAIGFEVLLPDETKKYLHHFTLYAAPASSRCNNIKSKGPCTVSMPQAC